MKRAISISALALFSILSLPAAGPAPQAERTTQQDKQPAKQGTKTDGATLTGCIDEQAGQFVLVNDDTLTAVASLQAEGFPTEGFAKFVGQKVTVRGTSIPGGPKPVFKVRKIEKVSDTCEPKKAAHSE